MLRLTIKVATVLPNAVCFVGNQVSEREAAQICEHARVDQRTIPNEAIAPGDVKICFEDDNGPVSRFPQFTFPAALAPEAIDSLIEIAADDVSVCIASGKVVAEMMLEGRSDAEIDYVLERLQSDLQSRQE